MTQNIKIRAFFMQNFMGLGMRKFFDPKTVTFGIWGLKTSFGQLGTYLAICLEP